MGLGGQFYALAAVPLGQKHGTHCTGGWVGPRADLDGCTKSHPKPGLCPWTIKPIESPYTNYTIQDDGKERVNPLVLKFSAWCDVQQARI
jgi:hypothetical protein